MKKLKKYGQIYDDVEKYLTIFYDKLELLYNDYIEYCLSEEYVNTFSISYSISGSNTIVFGEKGSSMKNIIFGKRRINIIFNNF